MVELATSGEFDGTHLFDAYHVLHNVRKRLRRKENVLLFSKILHARNLHEFDRRSEEARRKLLDQKEEIDVLSRFLSKSSNYCFAKFEPGFVGFSSSTSPNEGLHSLLKKVQPS